MKLSEVKELLNANVIFGEDLLDTIDVNGAFASDLLSDVLAYAKENTLFITGLTNPQVIRTVEVLELMGIVFVRGKIPQPETIELAKKRNIPLLGTKYIMFETCGRLYAAGLSASTEMVDW
ncbi:MAG: DRTGG domain-containing protein [Spirochaetota bacterium]|nr:DRTGG domain-containing protein [Spirochaetota bacterium]